MNPALLAMLLTGGSSLLGLFGNWSQSKKNWNAYQGAKSDLKDINASFQNSIDWRKQLYADAANVVFGKNSIFGSQSPTMGAGGAYWGNKTPSKSSSENPEFMEIESDDKFMTKTGKKFLQWMWNR